MLILLISTFFSTTLAADPPPLPYLTAESIADLFWNRDQRSATIILAADHTNQNQAEIWQHFNDPQIINYFNNHPSIAVFYLDQTSHQDPYLDALSPNHLPAIVYWKDKHPKFQRRPETFESPAELLSWLKLAAQNHQPSTSLYKQVAIQPDNIHARLKLINELNKADQQFQSDQLYPWLFLNNQRWLEAFKQAHRDDDQSTVEQLFQTELSEFITNTRNKYDLYTTTIITRRSNSTPEQNTFDNWVDMEQWKQTQFQFSNGVRAPRHAIVHRFTKVIQELQARVHNNTATVRDLFILRSLIKEETPLPDN